MPLFPSRHPVGTTLTLSAQFVDEDYDDIDPTTVTFKLMSPNGSSSTYVFDTDEELFKDSVGDYSITISPDTSGRWHYRWEATGTNRTVAQEGTFIVQASPWYDGVQDAYRR